MADHPPLLLLHGISSREEVFWRPRRQCLGGFLAPAFRVLTGRLRRGRGSAGVWPERLGGTTRDGTIRGGAAGGSAARDVGAVAPDGCGLPPDPVRCPPGEWDFDPYLTEDLPIIWAEACAVAGRPPIVLGYSLGGMLALLAQARGLIAAPALVLVATPLLFPAIPFYPPLMRRVYAVARRLGWPRIPTRFLGRLLIWVFAGGRPSQIGPELRLFHAQIRAAGVDVPPALLGQAAAWVGTGRWSDRTGRHDYFDELAGVTVPTLFIAGGRDRIAPPAVVQRGYAAVASSHRACVVIPDGTHLTLANGPLASDVAAAVTRWVGQIGMA